MLLPSFSILIILVVYTKIQFNIHKKSLFAACLYTQAVFGSSNQTINLNQIKWKKSQPKFMKK